VDATDHLGFRQEKRELSSLPSSKASNTTELSRLTIYVVSADVMVLFRSTYSSHLN
jgi:hypothetical protein